MNVHAHESQVFLTARHLDLLSNPALVTVVNPENLLQVKNVVVVRAEDVDFSYVCLTGTKLRSLKLSAPLILPPRIQTMSRWNMVSKASCVIVNEKTESSLVLNDSAFRMKRHVEVSSRLAAEHKLDADKLVAFKVSSPRNTTTYCDIDILLRDNSSEVDGVIDVHLDTDEANASILPDAQAYELYAQSEGLDHMTTTFERILRVGKSIQEQRRAVWHIEKNNRPGKQAYPIENETHLVNSLHFKNPNGDVDADLTVDTSNRHIHLSPDDLSALYGQNYKLRLKKAVAYTPEFIAKYTGFAAKEMVTIRNIKSGKELRHIRVLGPPRRRTQVELAYTDCLQLGVEAPARISGDNLQSGADCILIAEDDDGNLTDRSVELKSGIIRAWRHLHIYEDGIAQRLGLVSGDLLTLGIKSPGCTTIYHDVLVRVGSDPDGVKGKGFLGSIISMLKTPLLAWGIPALRLIRGTGDAMYVHLDTDEGNAACISNATDYTLYHQVGKKHLRLIGTTKILRSKI